MAERPLEPEDAAGATDEPSADESRIPPPPYFGRHYQPAPGEEVEIADPGAGFTPVDLEGEGLAGALASVAEPVVSVVEPIVENLVLPMAGAIGTAIDAAASALGVKDVINERLIHRGPGPLPNLYDEYPEARLASPRELGFRFVPLEDIRGTAVAGIAQRGTDFLPLPPFRGANWQSRWQHIKEARDRLTPLPPVDLIKYQGAYWVVDGHNRVAATIDGRGVGVDAMVVELVPLDGQASERPSSVLPFIGEASALRNAALGRRPAAETAPVVPDMALSRLETTKVRRRRKPAAADGAASSDASGAGDRTE